MRTCRQLTQSSRRDRADLNRLVAKSKGRMKVSFDARPHPDPLPRGEGEQGCALVNLTSPFRSRLVSVDRAMPHPAIKRVGIAPGLAAILPLPAARQGAPARGRRGERAGVRASVTPPPLHFSLLTFVFPVCSLMPFPP